MRRHPRHVWTYMPPPARRRHPRDAIARAVVSGLLLVAAMVIAYQMLPQP